MGKRSLHRIDVSWWVCGMVREVHPNLVKGYTHVVCASCAGKGGRPAVPQRTGMVLVHTFDAAGYVDGFTDRIADAEERASLDRATAVVRAATGTPPEASQ